MNINFETIMKKQIEQIANDEIEKMIREKVNQFNRAILSKTIKEPDAKTQNKQVR